MRKCGTFFRAVVFITLGAFLTMGLSGCAAGGFGAVRSIGRWNREMSPIPRVLVYVAFVIIPVYELAFLFDFILNNTVQFWSGSPILSAQNQTFHRNGEKIEIANRKNPSRKTVITVYDKSGKVRSVSELQETPNHAIEVFVNGLKKAEIEQLPNHKLKIINFGSLGEQGGESHYLSAQQIAHLQKDHSFKALHRIRAALQHHSSLALGFPNE